MIPPLAQASDGLLRPVQPTGWVSGEMVWHDFEMEGRGLTRPRNKAENITKPPT